MNNKRFRNALRLLLLSPLLLLAAQGAAQAAPVTTQTISLHPGWNAIYLEVQPEPRDPATVFSGFPVESVWTWYGKTSPVQFIKDPSEGLMEQKGWIAWFSKAEENFLTNLFAIQANRAYLVKVSGSLPATLTVTGTPIPASMRWTPDSFNFTGFHLNPSAPPSFAAFFAPSKAHKGQAMYRLSDQGKWQFINNPAAAIMRPGEAYWIYCEGGSNYSGQLGIDVPSHGMAYGKGLTRYGVTIKNNASNANTVTLQLQPAQTGVFSYKLYNTATNNYDWPLLETLGSFSISANGERRMTIAVRREAVSGPVESLLVITDTLGDRLLVPVTVE